MRRVWNFPYNIVNTIPFSFRLWQYNKNCLEQLDSHYWTDYKALFGNVYIFATQNRQFWPSSYHWFTFPWRLPNTILDYFYTMYDSKDLPFWMCFYILQTLLQIEVPNFSPFPEIRNEFWRVWPSRSWISNIIPESLSVGGWVVLKIISS